MSVRLKAAAAGLVLVGSIPVVKTELDSCTLQDFEVGVDQNSYIFSNILFRLRAFPESFLCRSLQHDIVKHLETVKALNPGVNL